MQANFILIFTFIFSSPSAFSQECKVDSNIPSGWRIRIDWEAKTEKESQEINPFFTDGCSRVPGFIERDSKFLVCCEMHDIAYWAGLGGDEARLLADDDLFTCVADKEGINFGRIIYSGPRSATFINTSFVLPSEYRWGYGWPHVVGKHGKVSDDQKNSIREKLETIIPSITENRRQRCYAPLSAAEKMSLEAAIWFLERQLN